MKMISRRRYNTTGRWIFFSLFVVVVIVFGMWFREQSSEIVGKFGRPLLMSTTRALHSTVFIGSLFGNTATLVRERDSLRDRAAMLESENTMLKVASNYDDAIQKVINTEHSEDVVASIISRPNFTPYDSLLIDKGTRDGVRDGAVVYRDGNTAVGFIRHAYESLSHVVLFSTAGVETLVYLPATNILVQALGMGGGTIRLTIPQGVVVHEGDIATYPTLSPSPIGRIQSISTTPTNPDAFAFITLPDIPFSMFAVRVSARSYEAPDATLIEKNMRDATTTATTYFTIPSGILPPKDVATTSTTTAVTP
jgi:cell shape-determining protein MreC